MEIKWQRGKFVKFISRMKIRVGGGNPIDIQKGDEFEYDGSILKYAGAEIASPQTRGAIKEGWAVPKNGAVAESEDDVVAPFVASRNVAKSQSVNRDLSRVSRRDGDQLQTDTQDENTILSVADRRPDSDVNPRAQPRVMTRDNNRRGMPIQSDLEPQDAVAIGKVRTAAKFKGNVYQNAGLKDKLDNLSGSGFVPNTVVREGISIKTNVGKVDQQVVLSQEDEGTVVGQVRKTKSSSSGGIEVKDTSNIRNPKKPQAAPKKPEKIDTSVNPRIRMARRIDPSFPSDWSFAGRLAERLQAAQDHGATPQFLEALYAAEGDQMRKLLERTFPKQFA